MIRTQGKREHGSAATWRAGRRTRVAAGPLQRFAGVVLLRHLRAGWICRVFLGYKGLSSTLIGIATGASCVLSVVLMPIVSTALERRPALSIPRVLRWLMAAALVLYAALALAPLPPFAIIALFSLANAFSLAIPPFLAQLAMGFNRIGVPVNFGLARGLGSLSYALGSVGLSRLAELGSPIMLSAAFVCASALFLVILGKIPSTAAGDEGDRVNLRPAVRWMGARCRRESMMEEPCRMRSACVPCCCSWR